MKGKITVKVKMFILMTALMTAVFGYRDIVRASGPAQTSLENKAAVTPTIRLNRTGVYLYPGATFQLKAAVTGKSSFVAWKSGNTGVASVNAAGKVTARRTGIAYISAAANGKTALCKIAVISPTIKLNRTGVFLYPTNTFQLKAAVAGPSQKVTWKSGSTKIATVSASGKVQAKSVGSVYIYATANGVTAKCLFAVKKSAVSENRAAACRAYASYLAKNESRFTAREGDFKTKNTEDYRKSSHFQIADMDGDGIPELITYHPVAYKQNSLYFFTYKNGQIVNIKDSAGKNAALDISTNAAGYYDIYFCVHGHLHANWSGGWMGYENSAYNVLNSRLNIYAKAAENRMLNRTDYYLNSRKVTESQYQTALKSCTSVSRLAENNSVNRASYLK